MNPRNFFAELKRRSVYKVAVAYAVVGWMVMQVASTVVPALHLPDSVTTAVVVLVLLGFPIALVIAWAFEMTPEGIKRTEDVSPDEKIPQWSARKFAAFIVALTLTAAGLLVFKVVGTARWAVRSEGDDGGRRSAAALPIADKSIAVLPLVNQSGDPTQEYFSDGLSEELINGLGKISELRVIGRNSSFHFKGKTDDSRAIGQALGVAHLLEGSVRKAGDRVRIGLQLVNAADGSQRWSETYDRELKDIFAVQEEIAKTVADQLRVRLVGATEPISSKPSNENLAAYNAFLQGKFYFDKGNSEAAAQASRFADEAIQLDPKYAEAHVLKARALYFIGLSQGLQGRDKFEEARAAARAAIALRPDLSGAHSAMAYIYLFADWNFAAAEAELALAHERTPAVLNNLGNLRGLQSRWEEALALREETVRLDPLHAAYYYNLGNTFTRLDRLDEAGAAFRKALELQPTVHNVHGSLCTVAILRGDRDAALREAELEPAPIPRASALALARFARGERKEADAALDQYIAQAAESIPSGIAAVYASRGEVDKMLEWLERAYQQREPNVIAVVAISPFFTRYKSDPQFVALCSKIGVPVPK